MSIMISRTWTKAAITEMKMRNSKKLRLMWEASIPKIESQERAPSPVIKVCTSQFRVPEKVMTTKTARPRPLAVLSLVEHAK